MSELIHDEHLSAGIAAAKTMMYGGASTTGGARVWSWLGENHEAITSLCSIGGFIVCLTGMVLASYFRYRADKNE